MYSSKYGTSITLDQFNTEPIKSLISNPGISYVFSSFTVPQASSITWTLYPNSNAVIAVNSTQYSILNPTIINSVTLYFFSILFKVVLKKALGVPFFNIISLYLSISLSNSWQSLCSIKNIGNSSFLNKFAICNIFFLLNSYSFLIKIFCAYLKL